MTVTRSQTWQERDNFISEPEEALAVLRDSQFTMMRLEDYLDVLEQRLEQRFPHLRAFARHSMIFQTGEAHLATRRLIAPFFGNARVAAFQKEAEACIPSRRAGRIRAAGFIPARAGEALARSFAPCRALSL